MAKEAGLEMTNEAFAKYMDQHDPLAKFRDMFYIPTNESLMGGMWVLLRKLCCKACVTGLHF